MLTMRYFAPELAGAFGVITEFSQVFTRCFEASSFGPA